MFAERRISDEDYERLLLEFNTVDIHTRNLKLMVTEVYKSLNNLSPAIMQNMFTEKQTNYELRSGQAVEIPSYINYNRTFSVICEWGSNFHVYDWKQSALPQC